MKQYLGNKRQRAYDQGWLQVPEKYTYLKLNASMRSSTGSRRKKALLPVGPTPRKQPQKVSSKKTIGHVSDEEEEQLEFRQTSDDEQDGESNEEDLDEYESSG